jgi:hypothetical protein
VSKRFILVLLAAALIVAAGFFHGQFTHRWGDSQALVIAAKRVHEINERVGDWVGRPLTIDEKQLKIAEIVDYISRQYTHRITGEQVGLLLICGRPGAIAVHTPDICYQGIGYVMGQRSSYVARGIGSGVPSEFWVAPFVKEPDPVPLHILWGWSDGGRWLSPDHPRLVFYRSPALYKLYLTRQTKELKGPLVDDAMYAFLKDFLPEVQRVFGGPAATSDPPASR